MRAHLIHLAGKRIKGVYLIPTACERHMLKEEYVSDSLWAVTCENCRSEVNRLSVDARIIFEAVGFAAKYLRRSDKARSFTEARNFQCFEIAVSAVRKVPRGAGKESKSSTIERVVKEEVRLYDEAMQGTTLSLEFGGEVK